MHLHSATCHSSFGLASLNQYLSQYFGFCFLNDDAQPFFALLPKSLKVFGQNHHFLRNADLTYKCAALDQTKPFIDISQKASQAHFANKVHFHGGHVCFFSYDFASNKNTSKNALTTNYSPTALIGEYDVFVRKDDDQWCLFFDNELSDHTVIQKLIYDLQQPTAVDQKESFQLKHPMLARWAKSNYTNAFEQVQDYLHAGDCYQINLTQEFQSKISQGRLLQLLPELLELSQAPFAGYFAHDDFELLSCSPELFIEFQANRLIRTRPIKGTLPRHKDEKIDQANYQRLATSEKDQAENLMIVDLLRNDLSVFAKTGSVKTPKLFEVESFAQVHHLVSEIQARLKPEINPLEMLLQALPGGSITGAPKIRAMQIIDELEGNARGAYCGSLGYFNYDGTGRFNILIRSLQRYGDALSIWAGGGITVASNVDAEYQECLDKVSALLDFLNQFADTPSI